MESNRHVQLPNNMTVSGNLSPKDLLVYVTIKSFMNKDTQECFPSLDTIVKKCGVSKPTVRKSILLLKQEGYLKVRVDGKRHIYSFNSYKTFEPFSYEFLDNPDLDANTKAYIIVTQQLMFKDIKGFGKLTYTDSELSELINLDKRTIAKYDKTLQEKGYLSVVKTSAINTNTGSQINEKIFHLDELGQAIIWTLQKHENDINELKEQTSSTSRDVAILLKEIDELKAWKKEMELKDTIKSELLLKLSNSGSDFDTLDTLEDQINKEYNRRKNGELKL
jgi:Mn-dependent DtxR family transcriptional regulator